MHDDHTPTLSAIAHSADWLSAENLRIKKWIESDLARSAAERQQLSDEIERRSQFHQEMLEGLERHALATRSLSNMASPLDLAVDEMKATLISETSRQQTAIDQLCKDAERMQKMACDAVRGLEKLPTSAFAECMQALRAEPFFPELDTFAFERVLDHASPADLFCRIGESPQLEDGPTCPAWEMPDVQPLSELIAEGVRDAIRRERLAESRRRKKRQVRRGIVPRTEAVADVPPTLSAGQGPSHTAAFFCHGKRWTFTFEEMVVADNNYKGYGFIALLLRNSGRAYSAWDMFKAVEGIPDEARVSSNQTLFDSKTFQAYKEGRRKYQREIEVARASGDWDRQERLETEFEALNQRIRADLNKSGRSREFSGEQERARKSVRKAIDRVMFRLEQIHPGLHQHLMSALHLSPQFQYCPDRPIHWDL